MIILEDAMKKISVLLTAVAVSMVALFTGCPLQPEVLYFSQQTANLYVGGVTSITGYSNTVSLTINGAVGTVTYTSADEDVATVSDSGVVTGIGAGTVVITAENKGNTATSTITVYESLAVDLTGNTGGWSGSYDATSKVATIDSAWGAVGALYASTDVTSYTHAVAVLSDISSGMTISLKATYTAGTEAATSFDASLIKDLTLGSNNTTVNNLQKLFLQASAAGTFTVSKFYLY
jgi:hypothetical protein